MANFFIIGSDGREYGPVTENSLQQWIVEGRIDRHTKVRCENSTEWKVLSEIIAMDSPPSGVTPPPSGISESPVTASRTSRLAIISLVLGVLGLFSCGLTALVGLILGIIALVKISNSRGSLRGQGLALAGTIVSGVFLFLLPVMAAMLLPALAAAKQKAQQINCMNNEKQLALEFFLYAKDHNGQLPSATNWCDAISAYSGSEKIFLCPAATSQDRSHYAYNAKLDGLEQSKVHPQTVLLFEADAGWNGQGGPELITTRHGGNGRNISKKYIVAFADGHVELVPESRLDNLRWNP